MHIEILVVSGHEFKGKDITVDELLEDEEVNLDLDTALDAIKGLLNLVKNPHKISNLTLNCEDGVERHFNGDHIIYATFPGAEDAIEELIVRGAETTSTRRTVGMPSRLY